MCKIGLEIAVSGIMSEKFYLYLKKLGVGFTLMVSLSMCVCDLSDGTLI